MPQHILPLGISAHVGLLGTLTTVRTTSDRVLCEVQLPMGTNMNRWSKEAFYGMADGFWAVRVQRGLTTPQEAAVRVEQQKKLIDQQFQIEERP